MVEDDYFLVSDTAAALRGMGSDVLGPCPSEDKVRDLLEDEAPTHAVRDLNFGGGGTRFAIAHLLRARGVPFVFLTGYGPGVTPADMADVVRLQKPLPSRAIVEAVSQLWPPRSDIMSAAPAESERPSPATPRVIAEINPSPLRLAQPLHRLHIRLRVEFLQ